LFRCGLIAYRRKWKSNLGRNQDNGVTPRFVPPVRRDLDEVQSGILHLKRREDLTRSMSYRARAFCGIDQQLTGPSGLA